MRIARDLGVVVEAGGAPLDFVQVLDARLAAFARQQCGEFRAILAEQAGGLVQESRTLHSGHMPPVDLRGSGARDRVGHVARRPVHHLIHRFERRGVLNATLVSALRVCESAGDPQ